MKKISYFFICLTLVMLMGCGQEHWQRRFEDKIRGEWNIDKITYLYQNPPNREKIDAGTIRFTSELSNPEVNSSQVACYYLLKDEISSTRITSYSTIGKKRNSILSLNTFTVENRESEDSDPLSLGTNTFEVETITDNYVKMTSNIISIELSR